MPGLGRWLDVKYGGRDFPIRCNALRLLAPLRLATAYRFILSISPAIPKADRVSGRDSRTRKNKKATEEYVLPWFSVRSGQAVLRRRAIKPINPSPASSMA